MGARTAYDPGTFCWVDLATGDLDGAKTFYAGLFGWTFEDMPVDNDGGVYSMASLDGRVVAAVYPPRAGTPTAWSSYVSVEDADATAARVPEAGGRVVAGPFDVFGSGRMAVFLDPVGAVVSCWQPHEHIGASLVNHPGAFCWNELRTTDRESAKAFYTSVFGWIEEVAEADDGYAYFRTSAGTSNGAMAECGAGEEPHWAVYFAVGADLAPYVARAEALGATVLDRDHDVGYGRFAVLRDPQGAVFRLFAGRLDD